ARLRGQPHLRHGRAAGGRLPAPAQKVNRPPRVPRGRPRRGDGAGAGPPAAGPGQHAAGAPPPCICGHGLPQRLDAAQAAENVRAMVKLARSRDIQVMLIATPEPGLAAVAPPFYREVANEFGLLFEESVIGEVLRNGSLKSDLVHPNAKGYRV